MEYHGENPTILYGYGGFGTSSTPYYEGIIGSCWLSHSSFVLSSKDSLNHRSSRYPCYVIANIRGGGEYGPFWHKSALKSLRQNAYDDFIAVAEDLIQRKITSVKNLGINGTCNGGLLMGNMIVQRPDLFGAVHCEVPLFNMKEYNKLLAGASYMAEYGNPDTEDWDNFLKKYSPYHHIIPNEMEGNKLSIYPPVMVTASTKDDRIHPYHARGFVKRLKNGGKVDKTVGIHRGDVIYYENTEGGHRVSLFFLSFFGEVIDC
jgi:prolyl oligopeptidase